MGDTLAGMIAGFAGQFPQASLYERVTVATYLHSAIAQELAEDNYVVMPTTISQQLPAFLMKLGSITMALRPLPCLKAKALSHIFISPQGRE